MFRLLQVHPTEFLVQVRLLHLTLTHDRVLLRLDDFDALVLLLQGLLFLFLDLELIKGVVVEVEVVNGGVFEELD